MNPRVVVVTGAGGGIPRACALGFGRQGDCVGVADINLLAAKETVDEVVSEGGKAIAVQMDVCDSPSIATGIETVERAFGPIEVWVNGVGGGRPGRMSDISEDDWDRMFALNVKSVFLCCKAVALGMVERKRGRIINISSVAGRSLSVLQGPHYSASKAAVQGLTRHLASELAPYGVTVNAVAPGPTATQRILDSMTGPRRAATIARIPLGRMASPDEPAAAVLFLASPGAAFITGATIDVNGGIYMS